MAEQDVAGNLDLLRNVADPVNKRWVMAKLQIERCVLSRGAPDNDGLLQARRWVMLRMSFVVERRAMNVTQFVKINTDRFANDPLVIGFVQGQVQLQLRQLRSDFQLCNKSCNEV